MALDMKFPEEVTYAAVMARGERHQLNWTIGDGTITPRLTCLHGTLPRHSQCAAEAVRDSPELLFDGYQGNVEEARDGIIISRWRHAPCRWQCPEDDGPEFLWNYETDLSKRPVATQRHTLRFVIGPESIDPIFECLHPEDDRCDAAVWREDLWAFPEWHAGPDTALRAGSIVSWWPGGEPNDDGFPHWAYEEHAVAAIPGTLPTHSLEGPPDQRQIDR